MDNRQGTAVTPREGSQREPYTQAWFLGLRSGKGSWNKVLQSPLVEETELRIWGGHSSQKSPSKAPDGRELNGEEVAAQTFLETSWGFLLGLKLSTGHACMWRNHWGQERPTPEGGRMIAGTHAWLEYFVFPPVRVGEKLVTCRASGITEGYWLSSGPSGCSGPTYQDATASLQRIKLFSSNCRKKGSRIFKGTL